MKFPYLGLLPVLLCVISPATAGDRSDVVEGVGVVDPPLFVAGRPKPGKLDLLWSPVDGADEYVVLRGLGPIGTPLNPIGTSPDTLFVDFGLSAGVTYTYAIQTVAGGQLSVPSESFEVFRPAIRAPAQDGPARGAGGVRQVATAQFQAGPVAGGC